jgi:hypothetical protein
MTDVPSTPQVEAPKASRQIGRRVGTGVAVVLAVVLFLVATIGVWAKRTVLSADRIVTAVDKAASDPRVVDALAERITVEIVSAVDIKTMLSGVLPDKLDPLAPVVEAAVRDVLQKQVAKVVGSPQGLALLNGAVRSAHDAAIRLLNGGGLSPNSIVSVTDGEVTLDVVPLIARSLSLMQDRGIIPAKFDVQSIASQASSNDIVKKIASVFGVTVPEGFGHIVIIDSQQLANGKAALANAQKAMAIFQKATLILVALALIFIAIALLVSADRRRTLVQLMVGIGVGAILLRIGIDKVVQVINHAIEEVGIKVAAVQMTESLTESLARTLVVMAIVALSVALIAYLLRPGKDGSDSRLTASISARPEIARIVIVTLSLLLLAAVGVGLVTVLIVGALCIAGLLYVGRHAAPAID